ncbi:hypothetical protein SFRURICE_014164 [Spodoptera frugiperda]|nr:hypothetical protein SFRURICE_014164 [Spodoptera frugiperda]
MVPAKDTHNDATPEDLQVHNVDLIERRINSESCSRHLSFTDTSKLGQRDADAKPITLTVNTNQTTPIKLKSIESFRLESEQYSNLAPKSAIFVTLTVNTNLTTPLKPKSIKPFRLQSVPNNYTYIHTYILSKTLLLTQSGNKVAINVLNPPNYLEWICLIKPIVKI